MRGFGKRLVCFVLSSAFGLSVADAAVLIPIVPVPGSTSTNVFGINDSNIIVGSYFTADGIQHGFFGTLAGSYTTFDYGTGTTVPRAINNSGYITGQTGGAEFERSPDGSFVTIKKHGTLLSGIAQGINNSDGEFVGDYLDSQFHMVGYYGMAGKFKRDLNLSLDPTSNHPRGINSSNVVVGYFGNKGFLVRHGVASVLEYPDPAATMTIPEGINDKGLVTGVWFEANGSTHGFELDTKSSTYSTIDVPGTTGSSMLGSNSSGLAAMGSEVGSFIYCPKAKRKCPGNGMEIADGKRVHVSPGSFLRYRDARGVATATKPMPKMRMLPWLVP